MSHLLHLDSSIRSIDESRSRRLSARYVERWRDANPEGTVTYRDLGRNPPPHTDATSFFTNFVSPEERTAEQAAARAITDELVDHVPRQRPAA